MELEDYRSIEKRSDVINFFRVFQREMHGVLGYINRGATVDCVVSCEFYDVRNMKDAHDAVKRYNDEIEKLNTINNQCRDMPTDYIKNRFFIKPLSIQE